MGGRIHHDHWPTGASWIVFPASHAKDGVDRQKNFFSKSYSTISPAYITTLLYHGNTSSNTWSCGGDKYDLTSGVRFLTMISKSSIICAWIVIRAVVGSSQGEIIWTTGKSNRDNNTLAHSSGILERILSGRHVLHPGIQLFHIVDYSTALPGVW